MMGRKLNAIQRIHGFGKYALYTHFSDVRSPEASALFHTGNIKILMLDIGWFWIIPLTNNRLSVGLVVQNDADLHIKRDAIFEHYFSQSALLAKLTTDAVRESPVQAEADFSFSNNSRFGLRFACCGDSAGFLDPVFSSGVFMAVTSAERIADRLSHALSSHDEDNPELHATDDEDYLLGFNSMLLFVERFYNYELVHHLFFDSQENNDVRRDIMALLAGDLWSGKNNFQDMLFSSRQSKRMAMSRD